MFDITKVRAIDVRAGAAEPGAASGHDGSMLSYVKFFA